jgi:ubiquinone/menaquinone biosynthesis C-methylase UbiE
MPVFDHRSYEKELLDRNDIPFDDIRKNMEELDFINRNLGGHAITLKGVAALLKNHPGSKGPLHIVEIGCGGGDNLRAVKKWMEKKKIPAQFTGVDINPECIAFARSRENNKGIEFIVSDYRDVVFDTKPQLIFSSLFCHHFQDEELVFMLRWMQKNSVFGFFINDLHRHALAYYSIKALTRFFSKSYLVKNDAPLSVKRGFTRQEWEQLFAEAGIASFQCKWMWAFRWLVTCSNGMAG